MKLQDSDKHYISEYYLRKGYTVIWKGTTTQVLQLTKRGSKVTCDKVWAGDGVRNFIASIDNFLADSSK